MKVDFIIVGFQKCGTSALHSFLSKHPKVIGSKPKELDFFNYDENFNKGFSQYHTFFKKPKLYSFRGFHFFEASPSYIADQDILQTATRIKNYNPKIKIIALVRNPVDRAFSAWNMYRKLYLETNKNWWVDWVLQRGGTIENVIRRKEEEFYDFSIFLKNEAKAIENNKRIESSILKSGHYFRGIQIYKEVFANNFRVFSNEDLNNSTGQVLEKIANFLSLQLFDWSKFNSSKVFKAEYPYTLKQNEKDFLENYYENSNTKLANLTNIHY